MPKARDPKRDEAEAMWKESGGQLDLVEIATRLNVSAATVRSWKSRYKWADATQRNNSMQRNARKQKEWNVSPPEQVIENDGLSDKYALFAAEYLRDFNATRAAMAVGYKKSIAHTAGWRLLKKGEVQAEIKRLKAERGSDLALDVNRIIAEYMKIAFADITDLADFGQKEEPVLDEEGKPLVHPETGEPIMHKRNYMTIRNSDEIDGTVVGEVKQGRDGVSIKLHDKIRALEKLEKYLNFMTEEDQLRVAKLRAEIKAIELKGF